MFSWSLTVTEHAYLEYPLKVKDISKYFEEFSWRFLFFSSQGLGSSDQQTSSSSSATVSNKGNGSGSGSNGGGSASHYKTRNPTNFVPYITGWYQYHKRLGPG